MNKQPDRPTKPRGINASENATDTPEFEVEERSKTKLKQDSEDLKQLGLELVNLPNNHLADIPLDDELRDAVELAGRINKKKDGYRRQLQLIGKILRKRDPEPIQQALVKLNAHHLIANQFFHQVEQLRDQIVDSGDAGIQVAIEKYPTLDRQKLRQLQRQAVKQKEAGKSPMASREIFQYLKLTIDG